MNYGPLFRSALVALLRNKMRSILTVLGITDVTGDFCTKWNERESTWRKSWSCRSRGTNQSKS